MKRWLHASENQKNIFKYPDDIALVEEFVADNYNPNSFTCVDVCNALEDMFDNLKSVPISFLWIDGHMETNHQVCLVEGDAGHDCNLIDPTGDQFLGKIKGMKCAAFHKTSCGYLSDNYAPMDDPERDCDDIWDMAYVLQCDYLDARLVIL